MSADRKQGQDRDAAAELTDLPARPVAAEEAADVKGGVLNKDPYPSATIARRTWDPDNDGYAVPLSGGDTGTHE